jgi:hypothetical protein
MCPCDGNDVGYIDQTKGWICWRLYPYQLRVQRLVRSVRSLSKETDLGVVTEGIINLHLVSALEVNECCFEALVFLRYTGHVTESAAINIVNADNVCVVAEGLKDRGGRGRTRCKGKGVGTARFER